METESFQDAPAKYMVAFSELVSRFCGRARKYASTVQN
ncbi:hypothetical protein RB2083_621 [Rhodobacteraceae bacterium HTCC2083]|nr:hypothetical protein RB2083_621 [Rhodobacteraceae bacterium HTCC2083]